MVIHSVWNKCAWNKFIGSTALEQKRKTSEEKLKQQDRIPSKSEAQFRALVEVTSDWIWVVDKDAVYTYSSPKVRDLLGYEPEEIIGKTLFDLMPADEAERVAAEFAEIVQKHRAFNGLENTNRHKDGHLVTLETSGVPVFDEQGAFCGYHGVDRDITERKQKEEALVLSQQRLVESQRIARLGHWDWDVVNGDLYWSDEHYRICGLEPGQIMPSYEAFLDFVHPDDQEQWKNAVTEAMNKNNYNMDHRIVINDSEVRYVHGQGQVQFDEACKPIRMMGTIQDITERKHLENALNTIASFSPSTGLSEYYRACVAGLARVYNTRYAFVGLFSDDSQQQITTQAVWANGEFVDNFEYELEGTPCADVLDMKNELITRDAAKLYPEDPMLVDMGVESYFGASMISVSGNKMGLMAALDTKPMEIASWMEPVLGIFAQRMASFIEHKITEEKIKASEKGLRNIFHDMQDTYYRTDNKGIIIRLSESIRQLLGYEVDELLGTTIKDLYSEPGRRLELLEQLNKEHGSVQNFDAALKHKDGSLVWVSVNAHYYRDENNNIHGVEGVARDISQHREAELQMQKMSSALEQSADMVMITDGNGIVEYVNPAFEHTTGYSRDEVIGNLPNGLKSGVQSVDFYQKLWQKILSGESFRDVFVNRKKDGSLFYEDKAITPIKNTQGQITHFVATGHDITKRMENEERLSYMAHHDTLTELPNRTLFMDRLRQSLAHARRYSKRVAVLFIDLDRFKNINDTLGHDIGDQMLTQLAERLGESIRQDDTVARLGGDEFAVLLSDVETEQDVSQLAQKILLGLEQPFDVGGRELFMTASIGISLFPNDGEEPGTLLKNADIAMYKAKDLGKNNYQFYSVDMGARAFQRLTMETNLRRALEREEFRLFYQPQINIETNEITGVETLIRWQHPDLGLVPPNDFIPLLEETGLITQVGYWVISTACRQMRTWHEAGLPELTMSVNISGRQFHARDFIEKIEAFVNESRVSPEMMEMEITESVLMENQQSTIAALEALDRIGFRIAIDDFGIGYSSLSYLRRFRIDTLKVDQSFIRDVADNPDDAAITSAIIAMAQSLKLKVIAEGVETQQQLAFLKKHDCRYMQGYLFSRPLPADELTQLLVAQQNKYRNKTRN
ncbi:MAG: hypothetical protein BMS9Abin33_0512 [Gammaproteobacteria bacterium]|nr:MAG: hypothetical protein BMS9Abin33_0512 [Gammaproteobacteria bacterium]